MAVPVGSLSADPATGAGRVWRAVLAHLPGAGVEVQVRDPNRRRRWLPRAGGQTDVWLTPGDWGRLPVAEPVVAVVHGAAWPIEPEFLDHVPRAYAEPMIRAIEGTLAGAGAVIVPSEYTRRGLRVGYGLEEEVVHVVPHGVDTTRFAPGGEIRGKAVVSAELGEERPYVLFASIPTIGQKNLGTLKAAMRRLGDRGLPHALVVAGGVAGGETADELAAITASSGGAGRVVWVGHVDDEKLSAMMAGCAAFCLPSLFESFGLTALEALACAAPVLVSNRGALPEVVGEAALIAEPSERALEQGLLRILTDRELAARLRTAGPRRARSLTWHRTAQGYARVLAQAANRPSSLEIEPFRLP